MFQQCTCACISIRQELWFPLVVECFSRRLMLALSLEEEALAREAEVKASQPRAGVCPVQWGSQDSVGATEAEMSRHFYGRTSHFGAWTVPLDSNVLQR